MPVAISILLSLLCGIVAFVGHLTVCIWLKNTVHAFGIPRIFIKLYDLCLYTWGLLPLVAVGWYLYDAYAGAGEIQLSWLLSVYIAFCFFIAVGPLPWCYWLRWRIPKAAALRSEQSQLIDLRPQLGRMTDQNWLGRACCVLPGNEALWLDCNARELEIPRLPAALDGLVIAHLSDTHFTGRVGRQYFELAVEMISQWRPDLIAVTGDLIDNNRCIGWLESTLTRLEAPHGVYFILGNHDTTSDNRRIRARLIEAGLRDVGGSWRTMEIAGQPVVVAGNELPWFRPAAKVGECPHVSAARLSGRSEPFKLLLAHSPDQFGWAQREGYDLVLAGHTHGGQIRFPFFEATVCPCVTGGRYASGTFRNGPTVMHVSRGLSSELPLRWRCPPEITRLVLRSPVPQPSSDASTASLAAVG